MLELVLAYGAGLLTLINPCVLPVLPIVLAGSLQASRYGPLALAGGMSLSFVALGLTVATAGHAVGIDEETVGRAGAVLMVAFGLVLLVPRFSAAFATATAGVSASADSRLASSSAISASISSPRPVPATISGSLWRVRPMR